MVSSNSFCFWRSFKSSPWYSKLSCCQIPSHFFFLVHSLGSLCCSLWNFSCFLQMPPSSHFFPLLRTFSVVRPWFLLVFPCGDLCGWFLLFIHPLSHFSLSSLTSFSRHSPSYDFQDFHIAKSQMCISKTYISFS